MLDLAHLISSWNKDGTLEAYNSYKSHSLGSRLRSIRKTRELTQAQLGSRLANKRQSRGFTQDAIAKDLKMSVDLYSKYEQGRRRPKDDGVKKIAKALGVSPLAIVEPTVTESNLQTLYALFELERLFGISVKEQEGDLAFDFSHTDCDDIKVAGLKKGLEDWAEMRNLIDQKLESASVEEAKIIVSLYQDWMWNYPKIRSTDIMKEIDR